MNRIYHSNTVTLYISFSCILEVRDYLDPSTSFSSQEGIVVRMSDAPLIVVKLEEYSNAIHVNVP